MFKFNPDWFQVSTILIKTQDLEIPSNYFITCH